MATRFWDSNKIRWITACKDCWTQTTKPIPQTRTLAIQYIALAGKDTGSCFTQKGALGLGGKTQGEGRLRFSLCNQAPMKQFAAAGQGPTSLHSELEFMMTPGPHSTQGRLSYLSRNGCQVPETSSQDAHLKSTLMLLCTYC